MVEKKEKAVRKETIMVGRRKREQTGERIYAMDEERKRRGESGKIHR